MYERKRRPPTRKAEFELEAIPPRSEEEEIKLAGGLAMDLALKWMREGTAPAQIVTHFLKANSPKEQAEVEKIRNEIELLKARKKSIELDEEREKKYQEVIRAISSYAGKDQEWEVIEEDVYPGEY